MTVKNPKVLVVDASITRATGTDNAIYPVPILCRKFLYEIYILGHRVIMTRDILDEWKTHQSRSAQRWYSQMLRKGNIILYRDDPQNDDLREAIFAVLADSVHAAVEKDLRLIEAALLDEADDIIASKDEQVRGHFRRAAVKVDEIAGIMWVNPTIEDEACLTWLRQGCPVASHRQLMGE